MLDLDNIRIDGGTQSRVELNESVMSDYADAIAAGENLPPVVVFFDGADHWLADGFHRYFGHRKLGLIEIQADIREGTRRDAVLYSVGANGNHGLRRSNADKRKAVETLLKDAEWAKWSDSAIAKACGVSDKTVAATRTSIFGNSDDAKPGARTVERNGKTYEQKTANIGKKPTPAALPAKAKQAPAPEAALEHVDHELDEAMSTIVELADENEKLRDRLAVEAMDASEEEKTEASHTINELRAKIKTLEAELDAVKASRDGFQRENAELKKQVQMHQRIIKKLESEDGATAF